jgi:hypothetical protein
MHILREHGTAEENAEALAKFLTIPEERALELAQTDGFFSD